MEQAIKKNGITYGVVLAVYLVLRTIIMYSVDLKLFVSPWLGITDFVVTLVLGIVAVAMAKKGLGGFITFKQAFTSFFITIVIGLVAYSITNILLFNVIDPGAKAVIQQHVIEYTLGLMQGFGSENTEVLKATVEKLKNTDSLSVGMQLQSLVLNIVIYCIVGLIVAVAFRNKTKDTY